MGSSKDDRSEQTANLFELSVALELDEAVDPVLSSPAKNKNKEDLSIPRERVAAAVRSTRLIAHLERPIRIGTYKNQVAYLLAFNFSFQHVHESSFNRIRGAEIEISFKDASLDGKTRGNPSVVKFHPIHYKGPISQGSVKYTTEAQIQGASISGGPSLGLSHSQERIFPKESKLVVHGVRDGPSPWNIIRWTISEDRILEQGMPCEMKLPVIVNMKESRRFSAHVTVSAHYMFVKGTLAKMFPVIGKYDDPLFFNHDILEDLASNQAQTSADGTPIAEIVGKLDDVDLGTAQYSSFATL